MQTHFFICLSSLSKKKMSVKAIASDEGVCFEFGSFVKMNFGFCMEIDDEIMPLLHGEDFVYKDRGFRIDQKDGITTFSVIDKEYASCSVSVKFQDCRKALKFWVKAMCDDIELFSDDD